MSTLMRIPNYLGECSYHLRVLALMTLLGVRRVMMIWIGKYRIVAVLNLGSRERKSPTFVTHVVPSEEDEGI